MKRSSLIPVGGVCAAVLILACSPDPGPFFTPGPYPENEAEFRQGKLGLITPALDKAEELLAFRLLSGLSVDAVQPKSGPDQAAELPPYQWGNERRKVGGAPAVGYVNPYKLSHFGSNVYYLNCLDDAFVTAVRTLEDRKQEYHDEAAVQAWAAAQDQVFVNCSANEATYPAEPAGSAMELVRADRHYQIAAAHFYAEDFEEAGKRFRAIAADAGSPWHQTGAYMEGRVLLREATLLNRQGAAAEARERFVKMAADPAAGTLRDSAQGMVEHLDAMEHATQTLETLAKQLTAPQGGENFDRALVASRYVLLADSFHNAVSQASIPEPFDWVRTLEGNDPVHAVERWRAERSLPWLTVALIHSSGKDAAAEELIAAAEEVPSKSPGFATVAYNAIRLRIERRETSEPRARLNKLLAGEAKQTAGVRNAWRAERMRLATSFDDFLHWAPRSPVGADGDPSPVLAEDSAKVLNEAVPLGMLARAAHSPRMAAWSADNVALAAWTRAFLLGNTAVASEVTPVLAKAHPAWFAELPEPGKPNTEEWRFRAAVVIGRYSQFRTDVAVDYRKPEGWSEWWCEAGPRKDEESTVAWRLPVAFEPAESVVTAAERRQAASELGKLKQLGSAQAVVGPIILAWAKAHPDDPLVPEALHRLVRVVRYGCHTDPNNGRISKAAFEWLHTRYRKNAWTAKTPYWFN